MNVYDLTRSQLDSLKQAYIFETDPAPAWGDLAAAADTLPDAVIFEYYNGVYFSPDDFTA